MKNPQVITVDGKRTSVRIPDNLTEDSITLLSFLWNCNRNRAIEIAIQQIYQQLVAPVLSYAESIVTLAPDGSMTNGEDAAAEIVDHYAVPEEFAVQVVHKAGLRLRNKIVR